MWATSTAKDEVGASEAESRVRITFEIGTEEPKLMHVPLPVDLSGGVSCSVTTSSSATDETSIIVWILLM